MSKLSQVYILKKIEAECRCCTYFAVWGRVMTPCICHCLKIMIKLFTGTL